MTLAQRLGKTQFWISFFLLSLSFCIPFAKRYAPGFILLLGIACLVNSIQQKKLRISRQLTPLLLLAALFGLHLLGVLYSENAEYAWVEIGIKLSFLAFPLIALLMPASDAALYRRVKLAFVMGSVGYLLMSIATGIFDAMAHNDYAYLSYELLSHPYHPTYAATYQALAIFILIEDFTKTKYTRQKSILLWTTIALMLIFISMLASKAGLIAAGLSIGLGVFYFYKVKKSRLQSAFVGVALLGISLGSASLMPGISGRIDAAVSDLNKNEGEAMEDTAPLPLPAQAHSSTELRLITWSAAFELLLKNPIGVGTGDTTNELVKIYAQKGEQHAVQKALNAHNQYLQTAAELGWPALLVLCASLVLLFLSFLKNQDFFLLTFLMLCGMNFLFESFLEVQAGIVFFCFWILVLVKVKR